MNKQPNAFAVYPDSVKMDIAAINELSAIFKYEQHAKAFANKMWGEVSIITPIYSPHFDASFKEEEFTAGQEVEVSDDGEYWDERFYVGKKKNGRFIAEDDRNNISSYNYCRPIKEQVTYYVYKEIQTGILYTFYTNAGIDMQYLELIHSFTI